MSTKNTEGWIGVDLDGTLAHYESGQFPDIGPPVEDMVDRVNLWLAMEYNVKIFTARANNPKNLPAIRAWLAKSGIDGGESLEITATKDFDCMAIYDDRAVQVVKNTGQLVMKADAVTVPKDGPPMV